MARLAEPLVTVATEKALDTIKELIAEQPIEAVVIGLPRSLEGADTEQTRWVRQWVKDAKDKLGKVPFYWQDEALTSKMAETHPGDVKNNHGTDALAAAIILEDFLDTAESERVVC
jgi:putative holliday junction resolvase